MSISYSIGHISKNKSYYAISNPIVSRIIGHKRSVCFYYLGKPKLMRYDADTDSEMETD
jgi:hypothetical protein